MKKTFTLLILIVFGYQISSPQEQKPNTKIEEIIIVFKTHFDNGYTDYAEAVINKYSSTLIEEALNVLERTKPLGKEKHFVWTLPGWPMQEILKRCDQELKPGIDQAISEGWFAIHSLPFTVHTESTDPEDLVRGFSFSSEIARQHGLELPRDAKLTDVPSHSWILPTVLQHAGVDSLHLGCNPASRSPEVPLLFWWEGPDGSKLMTMYWGEYYGTSIIPPEGWPFKTWIAIIHTNDNVGAPTPEEVEDVLNKTKELAPNAKVRIGRMSDFYDALILENPVLPVIRGDMPDTWIHGVLSMPKEVKIARNTRKNIYTLESLNTLINGWTNEYDNISNTISGAYENSILFTEHTFGLAMSHGHSGYWCYGDEFKILRATGIYKPIEDSWKEKGDRIYQAEKIIIPSLHRQLDRLAQSVNIFGPRIVVYNPLPWERSGMVKLQINSDLYPIETLEDQSTGEIINVLNKGNLIRFFTGDVPAMGYKTYVPVVNQVETVQENEKDLSVNKVNHTIENYYFKIILDPEKGSISSLLDKRTGREMVNADSKWGFGQYLYERFSRENADSYVDAYVKAGHHWAVAELGRPNLSDEPYKAIHGGKAKVIYEQENISVKAIMLFSPTDEMPHDYSITIALSKNSPFVDLTWNINSKPAEPWPEAGWISLPFNIQNPEFRLGRTGGIVNPVTDFVKGSNFDYYFLNSGMAIIDNNGNGFGICSPDAPGISLDRPGLWKYSGDFTPKKPNVFFNLYNNQWSTNFTEWIEGSWSARFYLWSITGYDNEKSIITPSEEKRVPLKAAVFNGPEGDLPVTGSGLSLSQKGILVTALGENPDGEGTILRLWEQAGHDSRCIVQFSETLPFRTAQPCDLRGQISGKTYDIMNGKLIFDIKACQPLSFILK